MLLYSCQILCYILTNLVECLIHECLGTSFYFNMWMFQLLKLLLTKKDMINSCINRYASLRRRLLIDPHLPKDGSKSPDLTMDNPLSQNPGMLLIHFYFSKFYWSMHISFPPSVLFIFYFLFFGGLIFLP